MGKKAVWLGIFSGVFIAASKVLSYLLFDQPEAKIWLISGILAAISLFLYLFIENALVVLLGALGGGFLAHLIVTSAALLSLDTFVEKATVFIIGGLLGILLLKLIFEWAMTTLSALIGAFLISSLLVGQPIFQLFALVGLTVFGVAVQGQSKSKTKLPAYTADTNLETYR